MLNSENLVEEIKNYFVDRFGICPEIWEQYTIFIRNEIGWITIPQLMDWVPKLIPRPYSLGIPFVRVLPKGIKPTSWGLIFMGDKITKNKVRLERDDLDKLLARGKIEWSQNNISPGYVALCYKGEVIGCGFYKTGFLENQIPKVRRKSLVEILPQLK